MLVLRETYSIASTVANELMVTAHLPVCFVLPRHPAIDKTDLAT